MKKVMLATVIVLLMAIAFTSNAQQKPYDQKASHKTLQEVKTFSGEVTGYANNDDYVHNGFYLQTGEVAMDSYTIIHCKTITINGKEYLTK